MTTFYPGGVVFCDTCGVEFTPTPQELPYGEGGVQLYFDCPEGHRFIIAYIDAEGVRLRAQLQSGNGTLAQQRIVRGRYMKHVTRPKRQPALGAR